MNYEDKTLDELIDITVEKFRNAVEDKDKLIRSLQMIIVMYEKRGLSEALKTTIVGANAVLHEVINRYKE